MLVDLAVVLITVPAHFTGGVTAMFHRSDRLRPELLTIHAGPSDQVWFTTSMLVGMLGVGLMCLPHAWPAVMSARDPKVLRRNYT